MRINPQVKCAVTAKWKNTSCVNVLKRSACKRGLAAERAVLRWRRLHWIDTLKEVAAQQVSDQQLEMPASASRTTRRRPKKRICTGDL